MTVWQRCLLGSTIFLAGCSALNPLLEPTATAIPSPTPTPSPTPVPLAALVNGEPIPMAEYDLEVARFERAQASLGVSLPTLGDYPKRVLQTMIEERVAAQAAKTGGIMIAKDKVESAYQAAEQARGGQAGLDVWLKDNLYTEDGFREVLTRQLFVQTITDRVADQVSPQADQVHARHILVSTQAAADYLLGLLNQQYAFDQLARKYSQDLSTRNNGGDLGWFARGTLLTPEVEDAAFALDPGKISEQAVKTAQGFHIVQTLEKQSNRPLSDAAYKLLRRHAVDTWLAGLVAQANVQILVTPSS